MICLQAVLMFDNGLPDKINQAQVYIGWEGSMEPEWVANVLKVGAIHLEHFTFDQKRMRLS
jgi:hypothetical protein